MKCCRFDGTMAAHIQDAGMATLESDPISLPAYIVDLLIVVASTVTLVDS
jgi:hypothetical protein